MYKRWQSQNLIEALSERRAVHLTGARQVGKTTLAESLRFAHMRFYTMDRENLRLAAQSDPDGFIERKKGETVVIDEIQKVPSLMDAIKIRLDHDNEKGQYLLTGSSNLRFVQAVRDSLAGRMRTIRLNTLTRGEMMGGRGDFLSRAFAHEFPSRIKGFSKRDVIHFGFCGGYPEALELGEKSRRAWGKGYLEDLLFKDVQDVTAIRKVASLQKMATCLLAHTGKFFELNGICAQAQLTKETAQNYIEVLRALYLFDAVLPWAKSDYAKLGKRVKYYAADSGLVANVLGWKEDETYLDDDRSGKLVETWVHHEIAALIDLDCAYSLTHYRDSEKREIDFLIENDSGEMLGIEVKAGSVASGDDFRTMRWFAEAFSKKVFTGIVLYSGSDTLRFGDNFYAVPLGALAL